MIKDDHFGRMELFMSLLEMNGICKSFNGIQVLKEVSLRVEAGEVHALLGENGAGKSTLMNILTGVHDKDAGTVVFDGKEMKNISVTYNCFLRQEGTVRIRLFRKKPLSLQTLIS